MISIVCDMHCDHMTLLQSLEGLDPKTKLSGASQVTLSEAEVRTLRRDIQGYQVIPTTIPVDSAIQLHYIAVQKVTPESAPQFSHCQSTC